MFTTPSTSPLRTAMPLAAALVLLAAVCEAQVASPCETANAPRIDRVYVDLNLLTEEQSFDGKELLATFGPNLRVDMDQVSAHRWSVDLTGPLFRAPLSFAQLRSIFQPRREGWLFRRRDQAPEDAAPDRTDPSRCAAEFAFNATPVRRVRVSARPREYAVRVTCPEFACRAEERTEFVTKGVPANASIPLTMHFGTVCSYKREIGPHERFPIEITVSSLLQNCDMSNVLARRVRQTLSVPPDGIVIEPEKPVRR
jgi:hypothetical protein